MKKIIRLLPALLILVFFGCSDDEPDPRAAFEGSFEMEDFDVTTISSDGDLDTVMTVSTNPEIEFERDEDLDNDELQVDTEELIEDLIRETLGKVIIDSETILSFDFDEDFVTEINADEFEIDDTDFTLIASGNGSTTELRSEFEGEGKLEGEELSLEYDIIVIGEVGSITFSGTATAVRD